MVKPSDDGTDWDALRDRVIGLGERSVHKNYYPALRRNAAHLQKLMQAIEQTTVGVVICDRRGVIEFANPALCAMTGFGVDELVGRTPRLYRSPETSPETYRAMWQALEAGLPWRGELKNRRKDGSHYWSRLLITPVREDSGAVSHFVGINEDITERVRAEERQKQLVDELNHRVKNTLAVVQALAGHTLRSADNPAEFCVRFESRLQTLSRTHDVLNESAWGGAQLREVLQQVLMPYDEAAGGRLTMSGADFLISPNSAVTLGLAFHELATNAARYGALAEPGGRIHIAWSLSPALFHLDWLETGGPPAVAPSRRGFGLVLLERGVPHQLGGKVRLDFGPGGLSCRMDLPFDRVVAHD